MFVLYCPGKLLPGGAGALDPPPQAPSAPGALNALENTDLNTCREIKRGGRKLVVALPLLFPCIFGGAYPLLRVKIGGSGMSREAGKGDIPRYLQTPRLGCYCRRGNRYETPTGRFFWLRGDF